MIKSVVRVLVVLFSLLLNIPIFAQPADLQKLIHAVDSLKTAAPNSFDYVLALDAVASHYFTSGDYKTALPYREECLKVITQQRDESDNAVLLIKTFLADTYSRLDRHKDAIDLYLECAGIYAKEIPPREDYFYALNCLVVEYCLLDDIPSAIQYRSQAANLVHRLHGVREQYARQKWLQGELFATNNQHEAAIKCFDESKTILEQQGETDSETYVQLLKDLLVSLSRYSSELVEAQEFAQARPMKERVIELSDQIEGIGIYLRAIYRCELGDIDFRTGNYLEALQSYHSAEEQFRDEDKEVEKTTYIIVLSQQALCLSMLNRFEEEIPIQSKVVELVKDQNGSFSKEYALQLDILGEAFLYSGQYEKALDYFLESKKTYARIRHPQKDYYEFIQNNLIVSYYNLQQYPQAIKEREDLLQYIEKLYGKNSQQYLSCLYNLADIYLKNGDNIKAENLQLQCWDVIQRGDLLYTPEAGDLLDILAMIYVRKGDKNKALDFRKKRLDVIKTLYGINTIDYAEAESLLANTYFALNKDEEAIEHYTMAINIFQSISETDYPAYVQAVQSLSYVKLAMNDADGSIADGLKALEAAGKKYGKDGLEYAQVLSNLGDAYYTGQMYYDALTSYEESYSIVLSKGKTDEHLYEHLIQSLPHAYVSVGDYDKGTQYFELYKDYLVSSGQGKGPDFSSLLHDIAATSLQSTDHEQAIRLNKEYIALLDSTGQKNEDYAIALSSLAYLYSIQGDLVNTTKYAELSDQLFDDLKIQNDSYLCSNAAYMYAVTEDESFMNKAQRIIEEMPASEADKNNQKRRLYDFLATLNYNARKMDRAFEYYSTLRILDEKIYGKKSEEYVGDLYMGALSCADIDSNESLSLFLTAIKIIEESTVVDTDTYAAILFWTGCNYQNRFDYLSSVNYYEKAAQLAKNTNNYALTQAILTNYGLTNTQLGNFAKAISALEEKLQLARLAEGHDEDICQALNELGRTHMAFGNYEQAISLIEQAREKAVSNNLPDYLLSTTMGIAECYENQQNYDLAAKELTKIREYPSSMTLETLLPTLDLVAAMYYQRSGNNSKAQALINGVERNLSTIFTSDPKIDGAVYFTIALSYLYSNDIDKSRTYFNKAQTIFKDAFGESYNEYIRATFLSGIVDMSAGDNDSAIVKFDRAKELYTTYYTSNNPLSYTSSFYQLFARYSLNKPVSTDLVESFISFEKKQAEELFFQMTSNERSAFWNTHSNSKDLIFSIGVDNGYSEILYNYSLFYKGVLLDSDTKLGEAILKSGDQGIINKYSQLLSLKEEAIKQSSIEAGNGIGTTLSLLSGGDKKKEDIYSLINTLERELALYAKNSLSLLPSSDINYLDVSKTLKKNEVAVEFVDYEKIAKHNEEDKREVYYCALVLKPGGKAPLIIPLCSKKELNSCILAGEKAYDPSNYVSEELYKLVWAPLEKHIKKGSSVYFSPAGSLYQVAIESITTPKGKPLSELYTLHRLSSTKQICLNIAKREYSAAILYGGLQYDVDGDLMVSLSREYSQRPTNQSSYKDYFRGESRSGWGYLPGTKAEIEALSDLFTRNEIQCTSYTGIYGNEESFKALSGTQTPIIHIATHGFYLKTGEIKRVSYYERMLNTDSIENEEFDPMKRSGLILSGGNMAWQGSIVSPNIEDGVLTAEEIANMHLENTDLIVLSACESGLGDLSSDGVMGIQRAFKNAGVQTLIMSFWKVDDEATKLLMTEFYKQLLAGETKLMAFDKAKESLRKDPRYSHPHYWAAFVMLD